LKPDSLLEEIPTKMLRKVILPVFLLSACLVFFQTCRVDDPVIDIPASAYPANIGKIILTHCAVSGCHNSASKDAAAGLDLSSWSTMFSGDRSGNAVTIPFSHKFSTTFLFSNTYADLGLNTITPVMPLNSPPLSHAEMMTLRNWIDNGAPDRNGFVMFSDNPSRRKFYVVNQGCDVVTVFDEASLLPMRYIPIGSGDYRDSPHMIRISPDGAYWYVSFLNYPYLQRYSTTDDHFAGQVYIGVDSYNTFAISKDSKKAYAVGFDYGKIARINLASMTLIDTLYSSVSSLHGSRLSPDDSSLYVTPTFGNYLFKFRASDLTSFQRIPIDGTKIVNQSSTLDPHDILFSPDGSKYFVTCQTSNQVSVMNAANDSLLQLLTVGTKPQELSISAANNLLFVSCMEDITTFPGAGKRGSVYVIDLHTYAITPVDVGYQPHGLMTDDAKNLVYVANRNANPNGPAPHHTTDCGGRNGYLTIIDMSTLKILPDKIIELGSDPYSVEVRH
jgi:DNA-binding beta-propeller fold protein YncE